MRKTSALFGLRFSGRGLVFAGSALAAAAVALVACVGDTAVTSDGEDSGGPDGSNQTDGGGPGTDGSTPDNDGSTSNSDAGVDAAPPPAKGDVLWAKTWLANSADAIVVDSAGNTYVAGTYYGAAVDFDGTPLTAVGGQDIFIAQLDGTGALKWIKSFGSTGSDFVHGLAVGPNNDLYVTGEFQSGSLTFGNVITASGGSSTGFVAKLSTAGVAAWGTAFTSATSNSLGCRSVALASTTLGVVCNFNGPLFSYSGGSAANHDNTANNAGDAVVVGIDVSAASPTVLWANAIGTAGTGDRLDAIVANGTTDFLVSGSTNGASASATTDNKSSVNLPHIGAGTASNAFFSRISASTGKADPWSKGYGDSMGADSGVRGGAVAVDSTGTFAYFGGGITTRGDVGSGTIASSGIDDAFCSQVSLADETTKWVKIAGGSTTTNNLVAESTLAIAVDHWNEVLCVGAIGSLDGKLDGTSIQSPQGTSTAAQGIFVGKFGTNASKLWAKGVASQQTGTNDNYVGFGGLSAAFAPNGEIRIATSWNGQFSFDGGAAITSPGAGTTQAALILALSP